MSEIVDRYRRRAQRFEDKVAAVRPDQWSNPSPCADWDARGVVAHIVGMHGAMLGSIRRALSPAPALDEDPLGALRSARADVQALLDDPDVAGTKCDTPMGPVTFEQHVDGVVSEDMVIHGWDLARATGQDDTIDPDEVARMWPEAQAMDERMRIPGAFGPGIVVYGPIVEVPADAPLQDRLLGLLGREP